MESDNKARVFWELGLKTIQELEVENGIMASGKEEIFGCIFGRDSLITSLKLIKVYDRTKNEYFLKLVKKVLANLALLQGRDFNIESGEEPGKCIHEFRVNNHKHLTSELSRPWYVYADGTMRNYDSVDATPLFLIALYRFWQRTKDQEDFAPLLLNVELALSWLMDLGDQNKDGFIDYQFNAGRTYGGLVTQNWMDSVESVFHESNDPVIFPLAPVEVQGYTYLALKLWSNYFAQQNPAKSQLLSDRAGELKKLFNQKYVLSDQGNFGLASAIDGAGRPVVAKRSSAGHVLWAALNAADDSLADCILEKDFVPLLVSALMQPDIFEPRAGIRTLSVASRMYRANSYHNGSIWPHDNSMIIDGFKNFGFYKEASQVREAIVEALNFFQTPIELFAFENGQYIEYCSPAGQRACKKQAWSAASILNMAEIN